jgi:hypothetical protein
MANLSNIMNDKHAFKKSFGDFCRKTPDAMQALEAQQNRERKRYNRMLEKNNREELAQTRRDIGRALKDCGPKIQQMVTPSMLGTTMVQNILNMCLKESDKSGISFEQALQNPDMQSALSRLRTDPGKVEDYDIRWKQAVHHLTSEPPPNYLERRKAGKLADCDTHQLLNMMENAEDARNEGNDNYQKKKFERAFHAYSAGCHLLQCYQAKHVSENELVDELRDKLMLNKAAAAVKIEEWRAAMDACDWVLWGQPDDCKALYRRAHARWGAGDEKGTLEDIAALRALESNSEELLTAQREAGKLYREVIRTQEKWENRQANLYRSVRDGLGDELNVSRLPGEAPAGVIPEVPVQVDFEPVEISMGAAKAIMLLLIEGYAEPDVQRNVREVIFLAEGDMNKRRDGLGKVAASVQYYVLPKFGFDASPSGVAAMKHAIMKHSADSEVMGMQQECLSLLMGVNPKDIQEDATGSLRATSPYLGRVAYELPKIGEGQSK